MRNTAIPYLFTISYIVLNSMMQMQHNGKYSVLTNIRRERMKKGVLFSLLAVCMIVMTGMFLLSCDSDSGTDSGNGDDITFWPPPVGFSADYWIYQSAVDSFAGEVIIIEQDSETFPGETYTKVSVGDLDGTDKQGFIAWFDLSTFRRIGYKAAEIYYADQGAAKTTGAPDFDVYEVMTPPLYILFDGQIGEKKTSTSTMDLYFKDGSSSSSTLSVECTLTSLMASIATPAGTANQAIQVDALFTQMPASSAQESSVHKPLADTFEGQYFFHKELGVISAEVIPGYYKMVISSLLN